MIWLIVVIVAVFVVLPELLGYGLREIPPWAFTRRPNGTFSRWQIAGQILVVGGPTLVCLGMIVSWFAGIIRGMWQG